MRPNPRTCNTIRGLVISCRKYPKITISFRSREISRIAERQRRRPNPISQTRSCNHVLMKTLATTRICDRSSKFRKIPYVQTAVDEHRRQRTKTHASEFTYGRAEMPESQYQPKHDRTGFWTISKIYSFAIYERVYNPIPILAT